MCLPWPWRWAMHRPLGPPHNVLPDSLGGVQGILTKDQKNYWAS